MAKNKVRIRGFARAQICERQPDGSVRVIGDSGWKQNTVTNLGFQDYIVGMVGQLGNSRPPRYLQIATQTDAVNVTQTSMSGEVGARADANRSLVDTGTYQMTGSFNGGTLGGSSAIGAIGAYQTDTGGSVASIALFSTSQWATNQTVSATYQWRFS